MTARKVVEIKPISSERSREGRRSWMVQVRAGDKFWPSLPLTDPFSNEEYDQYFQVHKSATTANTTRRTNQPHNRGRLPEEPIRRYRASLLNQLSDIDLTAARIYVRDFISSHRGDDGDGGDDCSIHGLLWEVLEHGASSSEEDSRRIRITRLIHSDGISRADTIVVPKCNGPFRVLLIIARRWKLDSHGRYTDISPSFIHGTLLRISRYLAMRGAQHQFEFEVVRPGRFKTFQEHLEQARAHGRSYDLVHFDVHGELRKAQHTRSNALEPHLAFAYPFRSQHLDKRDWRSAIEVATVLRSFKVKRVALNACLSSFAQGGLVSNLCSIFMKHGVSCVTAMSNEVTGRVANTYYEGFYPALILGGKSFNEAAAVGRARLRDPRNHANDDFTIPHNFDRLIRQNSILFQLSVSAEKKILCNLVFWNMMVLLFCLVALRTCAQFYGIEGVIVFQCIPHVLGPSAGEIPVEAHRRLIRQWRKAAQKTEEDHLGQFEKFRNTIQENARGGGRLRIGMMTLEDRLASKSCVFIELHSANDLVLAPLKFLTDNWVSTGWVHDVDTISASVFLGIQGSLRFGLWEYWKRGMQAFWSVAHSWWRRLWLSTKSGTYRRLRRKVIVVRNFDQLFSTIPTQTVHQRAMDHLTRWLESQGPSYVILIGTSDVRWTQRRQWNDAWRIWSNGKRLRQDEVFPRDVTR